MNDSKIRKIVNKILKLEKAYRDYPLKKKNGVAGQDNCKKRAELEKKLDDLKPF